MNTIEHMIAGVERHRLDNGLTVLTRREASVPIVTSMIWYRVGSRLESPGTTGVSHLLEHMMFKGSDQFKKGEIDYLTARCGGANNAFTANDYTAYYFSFASDRWDLALEIEADRMCHNRFEAAEFELERRVVLEELHMEQDDPWGALRDAVGLLAFKHHPYRYPVIGQEEDVASLTLDTIESFYRTYYRPSNATLVLVGDLKTDETVARVSDLFGPIAGGPIESPAPIEPESIGQGHRVELNRPEAMHRMLFAFPAPAVTDRDLCALNLVDRILSEGKLSRLHRRLIEEEPLALMIQTEYGETQDPFLFVIRIELGDRVDPRYVESVVFEELERLATVSVEPSELRRASTQASIAFLGGFETTLDQCIQFGLLESIDRFEYWSDYLRQLKAVTPVDVLKVARTYFGRETATVGIAGP